MKPAMVMFLTDYGPAVGTGHLRECEALASAFRTRFGCKYRIKQSGGHVDAVTPDFVVYDMLTAPSPAVEIPFMVVLDDEHHRFIHGASLVVNFSILQSPAYYLGHDNYLIGPDYMPMRTSVGPAGTPPSPYVKNILVTIGGSDPGGYTANVIRALEQERLDPTITVITGAAMPRCHYDMVRQVIVNGRNSYELVNAPTTAEMDSYLVNTDLAITAPGNTIYELAHLGIPSITICHHQRHMMVADEFARRTGTINLGLGASLDPDKLLAAVHRMMNTNVRYTCSNRMTTICDGTGLRRITDVVAAL
jgi:UDP-2,4-diacetamido-2,4,6-trideoxy-beta-L-altropyranose hydrolase